MMYTLTNHCIYQRDFWALLTQEYNAFVHGYRVLGLNWYHIILGPGESIQVKDALYLYDCGADNVPDGWMISVASC